MSIGILLLSHDGTATALLQHWRNTHENEELNIQALQINHEMTADVLSQHLSQRFTQLDAGSGILLLIDDWNTTLQHAFNTIDKHYYLRVVSGLNAAMLSTAHTHLNADLDAISRYVLNAGRQAIQLGFSQTPEPFA